MKYINSIITNIEIFFATEVVKLMEMLITN